LHDIGESRVYRILSEGKVAPTTEEATQLVRRYHPRAGAELAMRWALPDDIVQVCRRHEEGGAPPNDHVRLVRVSDVLVPLVQAATNPRESDPPALPEAELAELRVTRDQARAILERSIAAATKV
jgi:HD-like signal output (HDOD) protein